MLVRFLGEKLQLSMYDINKKRIDVNGQLDWELIEGLLPIQRRG